MNEILAGQVRTLAAAFGGYLLASGKIDQPTLDLLLAAAPVLAAMGWSAWAKRAKAA
jgi:hypothetical protein